ncbi:deoxyribodipyrimidine photo-lyase [Tumidithrix helvetica PCC 7403]|uniref:cryptochrome/photolyase family protein n=1 Tax=Tumidithrix helvetica TaxID=3457545 RepID=UPI003C8BEDEA
MPVNNSNRTQDVTIVWHRRDLRIDDNPALEAASQIAGAVVGAFIFDPAILKSNGVGGGMVDFMLGCLQELEQSYAEIGSKLLFLYGEPVERLLHLTQSLGANRVFFNQDVEPLAISRDNAAKAALQANGIEVRGFVDIGLHAPDAIATQAHEPYKVYTPFWRNWIDKPKPAPCERPQKLLGLPNDDKVAAISLPSLKDLEFSHDQAIAKSGEAEALQLLEAFCDSNGILRYKEGRDFPANAGTSMLSPHLRFGTVGIRRVWSATVMASDRVRSNEEQIGIQTWRQELAWREFYQHVLFYFPQLADTAYRPKMQRFEWDENPTYFEAWCEGRTGYPIVDAAMRQLNQTGWMHNRCRMIVASFLTKDLLINWQQGERYFMQKLIDGDLAANNGGWQWSASSGMDPKPMRIFSPIAQARKYDPEGEYILQWLPELRGLTQAELLSGNIPPHQCKKRNYSTPIVDHNIQQKKFKERYQECT